MNPRVKSLLSLCPNDDYLDEVDWLDLRIQEFHDGFHVQRMTHTCYFGDLDDVYVTLKITKSLDKARQFKDQYLRQHQLAHGGITHR